MHAALNATESRVVFEHPLNERTRSFLRLQFLLNELEHHRRDHTEWGRRACLRVLLDTLSVLARTDLKTELIKDLSEHQNVLQSLLRRGGVDQRGTTDVLSAIHYTINGLHRGTSGQPAALLRESDFLYAIHSRSAIPGGTCDFDLPAYHRWLCRPSEQIDHDLDVWTARVLPYKSAVELSLQLLRETGRATQHVATSGVFLQVPLASYSLIRVQIAADADVYPEISASKHRITVRFMRLGNVDSRNVQSTDHVPFILQCCVTGNGATGS